jgi:hypothetical protein
VVKIPDVTQVVIDHYLNRARKLPHYHVVGYDADADTVTIDKCPDENCTIDSRLYRGTL